MIETLWTIPLADHNQHSRAAKAKARFRFAPSPTGRLHLGHAYSALYTEQAARTADGELLLRIEDIDPTRTRSDFIDGILEDMDWLGIRFAADIRRQSRHFGDYQNALDRLEEMGLLYPCPATRKEIEAVIASRPGAPEWPRDPDGSPVYPGIWRDRPAKDYRDLRANGQPVALRLDMAKATAELDRRGAAPLAFIEDGTGPDGETGSVTLDPAIWGDVILARKETPTSYHLSVVVDDADQGITQVTRGHDLFHATIIHRLLQVLLDLPEPAYRHHRLIRADDTRKLSKSSADTSLEFLRNTGVSAENIRQILGFGRKS